MLILMENSKPFKLLLFAGSLLCFTNFITASASLISFSCPPPINKDPNSLIKFSDGKIINNCEFKHPDTKQNEEEMNVECMNGMLDGRDARFLSKENSFILYATIRVGHTVEKKNDLYKCHTTVLFDCTGTVFYLIIGSILKDDGITVEYFLPSNQNRRLFVEDNSSATVYFDYSRYTFENIGKDEFKCKYEKNQISIDQTPYFFWSNTVSKENTLIDISNASNPRAILSESTFESKTFKKFQNAPNDVYVMLSNGEIYEYSVECVVSGDSKRVFYSKRYKMCDNDGNKIPYIRIKANIMSVNLDGSTPSHYIYASNNDGNINACIEALDHPQETSCKGYMGIKMLFVGSVVYDHNVYAAMKVLGDVYSFSIDGQMFQVDFSKQRNACSYMVKCDSSLSVLVDFDKQRIVRTSPVKTEGFDGSTEAVIDGKMWKVNFATLTCEQQPFPVEIKCKGPNGGNVFTLRLTSATEGSSRDTQGSVAIEKQTDDSLKVTYTYISSQSNSNYGLSEISKAALRETIFTVGSSDLIYDTCKQTKQETLAAELEKEHSDTTEGVEKAKVPEGPLSIDCEFDKSGKFSLKRSEDGEFTIDGEHTLVRWYPGGKVKGTFIWRKYDDIVYALDLGNGVNERCKRMGQVLYCKDEKDSTFEGLYFSIDVDNDKLNVPNGREYNGVSLKLPTLGFKGFLFKDKGATLGGNKADLISYYVTITDKSSADGKIERDCKRAYEANCGSIRVYYLTKNIGDARFAMFGDTFLLINNGEAISDDKKMKFKVSGIDNCIDLIPRGQRTKSSTPEPKPSSAVRNSSISVMAVVALLGLAL